MSEGEFLTAKFSRAGGAITARFDLRLDNCAADIWSYLTQSDLLPQWLAPGRIDLEQGGAARLDFQDSGIVIDSRVTRCVAPRNLVYSWSSRGEPNRPIRWALEPEGEGTHLSLEIEIPEAEDMGKAAAGWAAHLEMLAAALAGAPMKFPFPTYKAAREAYSAQLSAATA